MGKYISFGDAFLAGFISLLLFGGMSAGYLYWKTSELQGALTALAGAAGAAEEVLGGLGGSLGGALGGLTDALAQLTSPTATILIIGANGYLWVLQASFTSLSSAGGLFSDVPIPVDVASFLPDPLLYYIFAIIASFIAGALLFRHRGTRILTGLLAPLLPALLVTVGMLVVTLVIGTTIGSLAGGLPISIPTPTPLDFLLVFFIAYAFWLIGFEAAAGLRGLISMARHQGQPFKTPAVNVPGAATTQVTLPPGQPAQEEEEAKPEVVGQFDWEKRGDEPSEDELSEVLAPRKAEEPGEEEAPAEEAPAEEEGEQEPEEEEEEPEEEGDEEPSEDEEPEVILKVRAPKRKAKPAARKPVKKSRR